MKTIEPCGYCGADATVYTNHRIHPYGDELIWSQGIRCDGCGSAWELDDIGFLPEPYRAIELAERGTWNAAITSVGPGQSRERVHAALVLKELFELSSREASDLVRLTPHAVFTGTAVEAEWVCRRLRLRGVACGVERCPTP